ncbi:hypothetical protein ACVW1A_005271 [Bradyrhizobium sp. LB1.3]
MQSEHSIRIRDTLHAPFPEIVFDIVGTYTLGKPEEFCATGASISWVNGPSEKEVYAALKPLTDDGMSFLCIRDTLCQCCGLRTMITPCFRCEEKNVKRQRKAAAITAEA